MRAADRSAGGDRAGVDGQSRPCCQVGQRPDRLEVLTSLKSNGPNRERNRETSSPRSDDLPLAYGEVIRSDLI